MLFSAVLFCLFAAGCTPTDSGAASGTASSAGASSEDTGGISLRTKDQAVFCLVPEEVQNYLTQAQQYDWNDFSTSVVHLYMSDGIKPIPVMLSWTYAEGLTVTDARVRIGRSQDLTDAVAYPTEWSSIEVWNLLTGSTYYWCVEAETDRGTLRSETRSFQTVDTVRVIRLDGVSNVRDIGGWKDQNGRAMLQGLAYRGKALGEISDEGVSAARALNIRTELDLRSADECAQDTVNGVGRLGEGVQVLQVAAKQYRESLNAGVTAEELRVFADWSNYPVYFHCAAGADRTGTLAFLLGGLCGVDEGSLITDYELTVFRDRTHAGFSDFVSAVRALEGSSLQEKLYRHCRDRLGLTEMELSNIYNILMTESAVFESDSLSAGKAVAGGMSFGLDLRSSGGVADVTVSEKPVAWSLDGEVLTVNASSGSGIITFKEGGQLRFSL